jgi:hypothetical protein
MLEEQKKFAESKNRSTALVKRNQSRVENSESSVIQLDPK